MQLSTNFKAVLHGIWTIDLMKNIFVILQEKLCSDGITLNSWMLC